jgi:dihydroorotate dehydrogenase (NAD+) catalytic subunit
MTDLSVEVCGLRLKNPTMLASGVLDETAKSMLAIAKAGAGAIVTKSIGREPRAGHPNPTIVELEHGLLNAMGLPNPGIDLFAKEIKEARRGGVPIIGSVFGGTEDEIAELAGRMGDAGVHAVELNLSCPHAKGYGAELGSSPERVERSCMLAKKACNVPVFAKLTPNTSYLTDLAKAAERGGADAIVAVNTLKGMAINAEAGTPVLGNRFGGLSGPAIKPVGIRCVYEIYDAVEIPVIGVGGVTTGTDAVEYIMAGASAVQIGTAVWIRGPEVFSSVCKEMSEFMKRNGYSSVKKMLGVAHSGKH